MNTEDLDRAINIMLVDAKRIVAQRDEALAKLAEVTKKYERLSWGVVANAGRLTRSRKMVRWAHVADATGFGSTSSAELCAASGFDPDGYYGAKPEVPR